MSTTPNDESTHFRANLACYDEELLRSVAGNLLKPRGFWPVEELIDRMVQAAANVPLIDRRVKTLSDNERRLLAMIGRSGQATWPAGCLIELLYLLGEEDALDRLLNLLQSGLVYPVLTDTVSDDGASAKFRVIKDFGAWLSLGSSGRSRIRAHSDVTRRVQTDDLGLPHLGSVDASATPREADGLEWTLRMAVVWQQASAAPFRLTQQGEFYKKDRDRLDSDALLSGEPADQTTAIPAISRLTLELALGEGVLVIDDGELQAGGIPDSWNSDPAEAVRSIWQSLLNTSRWNPVQGELDPEAASNGSQHASAYLACLLLLTTGMADEWYSVEEIVEWVRANHPRWRSANAADASDDPTGLLCFLRAVAYHLRLVQLTGRALDRVRLSPIGRTIFCGDPPPKSPEFPQTLLVQPNLEILLYRQGATPELVTRLSRCAAWKSIGAACNLQLAPESVYAALQHGDTLETILQLFQQHGIKPTPPTVVDALRTWAQKRDRITVLPSAVVVEFMNTADLEEALSRGVPGIRLTDRLAAVARESDLPLSQFRLRGNRDYTLPPEPCVALLDDGVTLEIDLNRSDLLLEPELRRFADPVEPAGRYCLTQTSLRRAAQNGVTTEELEDWFWVRCSQALPSAVRLLLNSTAAPPARLRRLTVLQLDDEDLTDGLLQWPHSATLIAERLGPTTVVVEESQVDDVRAILRELGMGISEE